MNKKILILQLCVVIMLIIAAYTTLVVAQDFATLNLEPFGKTMVGAGVGLAIGLAGLGAGIGMGTASAAAIGAISEKPEVFGRTIIYIVLIEAIAIYGFVISFLLLGYL
jgi:V/A-type H+-transporting ATPase subunit K